MIVTLKTSTLKDKILKPINRIVEDCILTITENKIQSISTLDSGGIIIFSEFDIPETITEPIHLNIKNINKLSSVLNCVTDEFVSMNIQSNHIKYDSSGFKFKFHLLEDGIIQRPKIKIEKIKAISYSTCTDLDMASFNSIIKSSSFLNAEQARLYFYTKTGEDRGIYCDITNKNISNSDSITVKISNDFDGDELTNELICDIEHIRKLAVNKNSKIRLYFENKVGFTVFDIIEDDGYIRYVLPTLSK